MELFMNKYFKTILINLFIISLILVCFACSFENKQNISFTMNLSSFATKRAKAINYEDFTVTATLSAFNKIEEQTPIAAKISKAETTTQTTEPYVLSEQTYIPNKAGNVTITFDQILTGLQVQANIIIRQKIDSSTQIIASGQSDIFEVTEGEQIKDITITDYRITATFNLDGGSWPSTTTKFLGISGTKLTIEDPIKEGYKFAGWSSSTQIAFNGTFPNETTTYTASWIEESSDPATVTVTFALDGGFWSFGSTTFTGVPGNSLPVTIVNPVKYQYQFSSWSSTVPSTFPSSDTTYTAQWTEVASTYTLFNSHFTVSQIKDCQHGTSGTIGTVSNFTAPYYKNASGAGESDSSIIQSTDYFVFAINTLTTDSLNVALIQFKEDGEFQRIYNTGSITDYNKEIGFLFITDTNNGTFVFLNSTTADTALSIDSLTYYVTTSSVTTLNQLLN